MARALKLAPVAAALCCCGLLFEAEPTAQYDAGRPTFRSAADAVRVDVLVTDARGVPVGGLSAADFMLRDNKVPQRVVAIERESTPVHGVLVLDTSSSVEGDRLRRLLRAAHAFTGGLAQQDRTTLLTFNQRLHVSTREDARLQRIHALLNGIEAGQSTSVFDAVWTGVMLSRAPGLRPLVVLFSDGHDNMSWLTDEDVVATIRRSEAVVYAVRVRAAVNRHATITHQYGIPVASRDLGAVAPGTRGFLQRVVEESGGRLLTADTEEDLEPTFVRILTEFRERYVLLYEPAGVSATGWHEIEVQVRRRGAHVTARRGYHRGDAPP